MAGGSGTRLWPLSRKNHPKQFLSLFHGESFLQSTARRLLLLSRQQDIYTVAGEDYKLVIKGHLTEFFKKDFNNLIQEPLGRNTAPAIALTIKYLQEKENCAENEILFFSPSDHIIRPEKDFAEAVKEASTLASSHIVTFGVVPARPETGYGYIELGREEEKGAYQVSRFVEKPDEAKAGEYISAGNYLWNSGMFLFSIKVMVRAFEEYAPELFRAVKEYSLQDMIDRYKDFQNISIDYAVMEKTKNILCKKLTVEWNDIGSWDSVYEILPKDSNQNAVEGDVELLDVKNSIVLSDKKLTVLIGVSNLAVIETADAILISDRSKTQQVKDIVSRLKEKGRREADEHITTYRPWGNYTVLEESERYKIKKIVVNPGASLSLQRHVHRSEHWIVVKGTAKVRLEEKEFIIHENESAFVPKSTLHRLSNPGKISLEIIEVQNGEYVGEDDIERVEDHYGRVQLFE